MQSTRCLNCEAPLLPGQSFCSACGQKTDTKRFTGRQLGYDFLQVFFNTEKGFFRLLKGMIKQPGQTAAEYVEGKRKKYFSPFAFMTVCIAFSVIVNGLIKPYEKLPEPNQAVLARIPDQPTREKYLLTVNRLAGVQKIVNKNLNLISILITPWFAFFLFIFYKRRGRNLSELIIAYILFAAICNLLACLLFSPLMAATRGSGAYNIVFYGNLALQMAFVAWGMTIFLKFKTAGKYIEVLAVLSLAGIIGFLLILVAYFLFVYHKAGEVFQYL
jgi:hypothetical protein